MPIKPVTLGLVLAGCSAFFGALTYVLPRSAAPSLAAPVDSLVRVLVNGDGIDWERGVAVRDRLGREWPCGTVDRCVFLPRTLNGTIVHLVTGAAKTIRGEGRLDLDDTSRMPRLEIR